MGIHSNPDAMPSQNPRKPFPAWRLPKGMINANDDDLEKSIESCERWEWFGGTLVFVGVGAAVVIAAIHPKYDSFLEQWGSVIADGLVAAGVAIEIKFGQMAGLRQNELKRRSDEKVAESRRVASEAQQQAAEARERTASIEKLTAWRRVLPKQQREISDAIQGEMTSDLNVRIEWERSDPEAFSYAFDLHKIFTDAGVEKVSGDGNSWTGWQKFGLYVAASPGFDLSAIRAAFERANIFLAPGAMPFGLPTVASPAGLYIFVAPKLPVHFETSAMAGDADRSDASASS
jgi:hypothetical protein